MSTLILIRHGQSQWNLENRFTGWTDISLTPAGRTDAELAGKSLKDIRFDLVCISRLKRAKETLEVFVEGYGLLPVPVLEDSALNERHYGDLQGLNKAQTAKKFGDEQVKIWRRSYDIAPPNGESLKDTAARVLPYFESKILADLKKGRNVIVAAHGNSLRAVVMQLDKLTKEQVLELNLATGVPILYTFNGHLNVLSKKELI